MQMSVLSKVQYDEHIQNYRKSESESACENADDNEGAEKMHVHQSPIRMFLMQVQNQHP